jgi:hypothetical protein
MQRLRSRLSSALCRPISPSAGSAAGHAAHQSIQPVILFSFLFFSEQPGILALLLSNVIYATAAAWFPLPLFFNQFLLVSCPNSSSHQLKLISQLQLNLFSLRSANYESNALQALLSLVPGLQCSRRSASLQVPLCATTIVFPE